LESNYIGTKRELDEGGENKSENDYEIDYENNTLSARVTFSIDIVCTDETEKAFAEQFEEYVIEGSQELEGDEFNNLIEKVVFEKLYKVTDDTNDTDDTDDTIECDSENDNDISYYTRFPKIGDKVSMSYIPSSQKYIEHYAEQAFTGEVFFIDIERNNFFAWNVEVNKLENTKIEINYRVQSFKREGCHFFGMADCYSGSYEFNNV